MLSILTPKGAPSKLCLGREFDFDGIAPDYNNKEGAGILSIPHGRAFPTERSPGETPAQAKLGRGTRDGKLYSNSSTTISGFDPSRSGGPQVPAPLEVKTCIFPIRLRP